MTDIKNKNAVKDQFLSLCAILPFFEYFFLMFFGYAGNRFGVKGTSFDEICYFSLFAIFYVLYLNRIKFRLSFFQISLFFIFFASYIYVTVYSPDIYLYKGDFSFVKYILYYPMVAGIFYSMKDFDLFFKYIKITNRCLVWIAYIYVFLEFSRSGYSYNTYNMDLGYQLAFSTIIFLSCLFKKFNLYDLLNAILSGIVVLAFGSRGAVLAILVYLCIVFYRRFFHNVSAAKKTLFCLACLVVAVSFAIYLDDILYSFAIFLSGLGINSRTVLLLLYQEYSYDSGRFALQEYFISSLRDMPIFGFGILGDRKILYDIRETYPHNIFLELIANYGIVLGGLFGGTLVYKVFKILKGDSMYHDVGIAVVCFTFTYLMLSSSYLLNTIFFVALGLLFNKPKDRQETIELPIEKEKKKRKKIRFT